MEEDDRREWKDMKKEYQKLQWAESMERNLAMLKQIMEHRRNELHIADMSNDHERRRAIEAELKDLKVRQARLSCALWIQPEDLPSSQTLLEMKNPKKLQAELEAKLVQLGLVEARVFQKPPMPMPSKADAATEPQDVSEAQPEPMRLVPKLPLNRPVAATEEDGRFQPVLDPRFTKASDPARSPFSDDSPCKTRVQGARPHTPRRKVAGGQDQAGDTGGKLADDSPPDGGTGSTTSPVGKGKGSKGFDGKGADKGPGKGGKGPAKGPPTKGGKAGVDGDGKGGKGMKGPPGKGGRIRKVTPLGRRFHWKELNAEKVKGTVFDRLDSPMMDTIDVQFDGLKNYFADDDELSKQGMPTAQQSQEMVKVFDNSRMQNIAIVMRGIFGQMPLVQETCSVSMSVRFVSIFNRGVLISSFL